MRWQTLVLAMTLIVLSMVAVRSARGQPVAPPNTAITFWVCDKGEPAFKRVAPDKLVVRCPTSATPDKVVFTIQGCVGPHVKRMPTPPRFTITCDRMVQYTPGVPIDP